MNHQEAAKMLRELADRVEKHELPGRINIELRTHRIDNVRDLSAWARFIGKGNLRATCKDDLHWIDSTSHDYLNIYATYTPGLLGERAVVVADIQPDTSILFAEPEVVSGR